MPAHLNIEYEPTNQERAELARKVLQDLAAGNGSRGIEYGAIMDLLANIMHFCWESEIDFEDLLEGARYQFEGTTPIVSSGELSFLSR